MNQEKLELSSIEYTSSSGQEIIIDEKNNNKLSPISLSSLDSVLSNKITIIFSQGTFNLSPIISCIFALEQQSDVLIGIPKTRFNESFEKNTSAYFSLMYKKILNSMPTKSFYFYSGTLWCKGSIGEETNELDDIKITTRPKYGTRKFKNDYDTYVIDNLTNGKFQRIPKIVSIPIAGIVPSSIIGEKSIKFKTGDYKLKKLNPKLIIYESINERRFSFDNLIELINISEKSDVKLVLHFSWPYLKGLSSFLTKIKDNVNINILHLGKRFCIESRDDFEKPPSDILPLSLEGNAWNLYYPSNTSIDFKMIVPPSSILDNNLSITDVEYCDWPFDSRVRDIRDHLKYESVDKIDQNILKFPPIFDSFLSPYETKRSCEKNGMWITLPLHESFSTKSSENSHAVGIFNGLCSDLEKCRDISYELRNLYTTATISKKTLFQSFLIEKINYLCDINNTSLKSEAIPVISILVANLHPRLATKSSFSELINYLVNSMKNVLEGSILPKLINEENKIDMKIKFGDLQQFENTIYKNKILYKSNIKQIKKLYSKFHPNLDVHIVKKDTSLRIIVKTKEPIEYLELNRKNSVFVKRFCKGLVLYDAVVRNNGSFNENIISNISFDRKNINSIVEVEFGCRSNNGYNKISYVVHILYSDLSKMQELPQELIQKSELLIPGPIPFHTISDDYILISHGYDTLLLPFKKVVFFAYPGYNFKQLLRQIKLYDDLISENQTNIGKRDLLFSIEHTNKSQRFKLPSKPHFNEIQEKKSEMDTPFDTAIRQELLDGSNVDGYEREEIKTLVDIWDSIQKNTRTESQPHPFINHSSKEHMEFCVEYETNVRDIISFSIDTLIRKKDGHEYILLSVEELSEGDQIFYIESDERESVENYLLRTLLSEEELSLEKILGPLVDLKSFYETIKSINIQKDYDENQMKKIDWLSLDQKKNLFDLLSILLNKDFFTSEDNRNLFVLNSIWRNIESERLIEIFEEGTKKITHTKLFNLATEMGLNYKESSFKALCSTAINEQKHYSFQNEKNLLALGLLLGHQDIINNYQTINEKGVKIGTFLRQVGRSIQRVASGNDEPFNEIDMAIEGKTKKCTIIKTGKC